MKVLTILIVLALLATAGALLTGIFSMTQGGEFDRKHSTQFMSARVILQGIALLLLVVALIITL